MLADVYIEQSTDQFLVWGVMPLSFLLEKVHTGLAQGYSHLNRILFESQFLGRRKKVLDHPQVTQWFIGIFNFLGS